MKVRTMEEIRGSRVTVTVDVQLSGSDALAEAEAERDLLRSTTRTDHNRIMALEALVAKVRESVWAGHLDEAMEKRHDEDTVTRHAHDLAGAVAFVRASVGQP